MGKKRGLLLEQDMFGHKVMLNFNRSDDFHATYYTAATKAATHDYNGTAGYKLVISTQLLRHRSTSALAVCEQFEAAAQAGPHTLSYDTTAASHADGQVGCFRGG